MTISDDVFRQLASAIPGPVCPHLRHLAWESARGWEPVQQFFSPCLVSVVFSGDYEVNPITDLALTSSISLIPTTYLEKLNLDIIPPYPSPIHFALSGVVQRLNPCFKRLMTASSLSEAAWEHLASLPNLESLGVSGTPHAGILESIPRETAFPALQGIKLKVDEADQRWSVLFSLVESSPLQKVAARSSRRIQGVDAPGQVITAMLGAELQRTITTLIFSGLDPANLTFILRLRPFSRLRALDCNTRCRRSGQCVSPLVDSDIEQLASGSPRLVRLCLGHKCRYSRHHTTIKSFMSLSTHCRSLKTLRLPCDLTDISEDIKMESGEPDPRLVAQSHCKLRFFALGWVVMPRSNDDEGLRIASSAICHLFPLL